MRGYSLVAGLMARRDNITACSPIVGDGHRMISVPRNPPLTLYGRVSFGGYTVSSLTTRVPHVAPLLSFRIKLTDGKCKMSPC